MLLLTSLLAAAGHALSTLELRTSDAHRHAVDAFYRADGALQEYVGSLRGALEPASFSFSGGVVVLSARKLLELPNGRSLHRVLSRSALTVPGGGITRRGVGSVVLTTGRLRLPAALLSFGTLDPAGGSAMLDGFDAAGASGCAASGEVAGLAVSAADPPALPPEVVVRGDPPVLVVGELAELRGMTGLDWTALLATFGPEATARVPAEPWPDGAGSGSDPTEWPVLRIQGPLRLDASHAGRGAILADGDLELADGFTWEGLILVEGGLVLSGAARVLGGVAAGLGLFAGRDPGTVTISGTGVELGVHSCHAAAAAAALDLPPAVLPGTWFEEMEAWF